MYEIVVARYSDFCTKEDLLVKALFLPDGDITPDDGGDVKYRSFEECCLREGLKLTEEQAKSDFCTRQDIIIDIGKGYFKRQETNLYPQQTFQLPPHHP